MPTMNLHLALIDLRFLKILFPLEALWSFLKSKIFSMIFLEPKWSQGGDKVVTKK
jgi:hypothetical protein